MFEDILDDPEVQEMIEKYDGSHQNDVPLDDFGNPLPDPNAEEEKETDEENKEETTEEESKLDVSLLDDFVEEVPEIDYTPKTEFSKTLDISKIDDGFQKYVLTHLEPLEITDSEGRVIRAYTADDIPKDFQFTDQQAATRASTELARLGVQGDVLKREYEESIAKRESIIAENDSRVAIKEGLTEAIENGEFPKLELDADGKVDVNSKINQLANDIISYQNKTNKDRTPTRTISFDTALNRFKKDNPDRFKDLDGSLSKEDEDRINFAKRTSRTSQRVNTNSGKSMYNNLSREEFDELLNDPDFDVRKLLK